ncbi:MAG: FAD-dependent oxidoreductase [Alphaproteobacteria bacterium]|nr:MAG: FAD-dependent oxidoreductase [Alphaproteobacteria bacterium]
MVIGAGVLGLCSAAELAARGHAVTVIDPGGANASAVAAGMIAPAMESLLEDTTIDRAALLRRARDLWPVFAETHGLKVRREGAEWRGEDAEAALNRLSVLGFKAEAIDGGVRTLEDWRVDVGPGLAALARVPGVSIVRATVSRLSGDIRRWRVEAADGRVWFTPSVVVATGAAAAIAGLPPAVAERVAAIQPIKGQLSYFTGLATPSVIRTQGAYVAPADGGVVIGATMKAGDRDLTPDPDAAHDQASRGLGLLGLDHREGVVRVGIRGATSDGLPLAGPTQAEGLHLALAPRRNGWLLGPLVARVVADGIEGATPVPDAAALDPARFD